MLLGNKVAVVYGGSGVIGRAVARAFASEGARLFVAGRTRESLDAAASDLARAGAGTDYAVVDALDERAVDEHFASVVRTAGAVDICFNAVSHADVHGSPLLTMPLDDFMRPIVMATRTLFVTTRAAARHMTQRRSGVIMAITATTSRQTIPEVGGTGVAFDGIESQCRQWAAELGPLGVRVVWLLTTGIPEALHGGGDLQPAYGTGSPMTRDQLVRWNEAKTMLGRLTTLADVGAAAAWLASDAAQGITGAAMNLTYGAAPTR
ncbi:MAG TPA: SDR family oxidoreductase [Candidatus Acidoferrum sp.]|nr:SDR family oxidoreductase [Candidatus Acidoferrum sp.]